MKTEPQESLLQANMARRLFLRYAGVGVASVGLLATAACKKDHNAPTPPANGIDLGAKNDFAILNYAYALEQLEAAFYAQVLKTPYSGMESAARDVLTAIGDHEIAHREFFKAALKSKAIPSLEVDFTKVDFGSKDSVLSTARTFEDLGVAAYNGAGQMLEKGEYLLLAGKIVSVEARHAAAIRDLMGPDGWKDSPVDDKGLDQALAPDEVLSKASPFIKNKISADDLG